MKQYLAEFLGTLFFVYVTLATGHPIAIGAALTLSMLLTNSISGGHINPAVSVVMASYGKIPKNELIPYCLSQILGALVALEIYKQYQI